MRHLLQRMLSAITLKRVVFTVLIGMVGGCSLIIGSFFYLRADLPSITSLEDYAPAQSTRVYSDDGHLVGEFFFERRTVLPIESLPAHLRHCFLAAEDARFYEHEGLDYVGIFRAAIKNLRPGAHLQGASTITQQIVKTMVVGPERSYTRKMREALLSRDLEQLLSKDEILHLYVNQIYFGAGTYGVEEAAQKYFGKSARDVSLGEAAYLASIPKHPSRYTIIEDPAAAKERQRYVLEQMRENGWADADSVARAIEAPVPVPAEAPTYLRRAPHYVEEVRRQLLETYGEERLTQGGLTVYTGMHAEAQVAAQQALRSGLEDLGRRHGWPGAALRIEVDTFERSYVVLREELDRRLDKFSVYAGKGQEASELVWDLSDLTARHLTSESSLRRAIELVPADEYARTTGLVVEIDSVAKVAWVDLGTRWGRISLESLAWARRFAPWGKDKPPKSPSEVLNRGDIVDVLLGDELPAKKTDRPIIAAELVPRPLAQGAVVAIHPHTRHVISLVGGYEQHAGDLIRATQSRRQPGSSFKPFVYAAALATRAITPATQCPDSPVVIRDQWTGKAWKPQNYEDGRFDGNITYRRALTKSKNTCSVRLIDKVGYEAVIEMARAAGIKSDLPENLTLALGTGDVTPMELTNAYSTIASGGLFAEPILVRKVVDVTGEILEEHRAELEERIAPAAAFVVSHMMRSVVEEGTARRAKVLERPLAGKTGTTNESRNVWFSGFSPELVATVWVGFDDNKPLGRATGGGTALPIWIRFMGRALTGIAPSEFVPPDEGVVFFKVDPETGYASTADNAIEEAFLEGTEPTENTAPLQSTFLIEDEDDRPFGLP